METSGVKRFRLTSATSVVLIMLCVMYFLTYLDRVNVSTAAVGFAKDFNLSHTQVGFVFSAFGYPYLLFQFIGGWVSDRFGARHTLIFCGLLWGIATLLVGMSTNLTWMLSARVLLGIGEGGAFLAATVAMSRWVAKERRGFAQGITHSASRIGNAAAPLFVAALMAMHSWRAPFFVTGVVDLLWVVGWILIFTEYPKDHPRITAEELAHLPPPKARPKNVPYLALLRRMLPVTIVYFCYGWTLWLFLSWIPQYFLHNYNLRLGTSALFTFLVFSAGVVGDTLGGLVTDRIYKRTGGNVRRARSGMVAVCMLLAMAAMLPMMFMDNLYGTIACLAGGFFFAEMTIGPMWAIPMDIAHRYSGTACGFMNIGSASAVIVSPVVGGFLIDRFHNWDLPFFVSMGLLLLGVLLTFGMRPDKPFRPEADDGLVPLQPEPEKVKCE